MKETNDAREARNTNGEIRAAAGKNEMLKKAGIVGAIALVAFLLGFLPMWLSARTHENERDAAIKTLRPSVLQNTLATAAINAHAANLNRRASRRAIFSRISALKSKTNRARLTPSKSKPRSRFWRSATKRLHYLRETTRRRLTV